MILEYLEETQPHPLHPADPLERAEHRAWIEFGSAILNDIAGLYSAKDAGGVRGEGARRWRRSSRGWRRDLGQGPWFDGEASALVDAVFGPVFRYFDVFDRIGEFGILTGKPKVAAWRKALAARPSIRQAVGVRL